MAEEEVPPPTAPSGTSAAVDLLVGVCDAYVSARSQLDQQLRARFLGALDAQRTRQIGDLQERLTQGSPEVQLWRSPELIGCGGVSVAPAEVTKGVPYWSEEGMVVVPGDLTPTSAPPERTRVRLWRMELPGGSPLRNTGAGFGLQVRVSTLGGRLGTTDVRTWMGTEADHEMSIALTGEWQWLSGSFPGITVEAADASRIDASGAGARVGLALTHVRPGHAWKGWLPLHVPDDTTAGSGAGNSDLHSADSAASPMVSAGRVELSVESEAYFFELGDGVTIRKLFCKFDAGSTGMLSSSEFGAFAAAVNESTVRLEDLKGADAVAGGRMPCITLSEFAQLLYLDPHSCHFGRQNDHWAMASRSSTLSGQLRDSRLGLTRRAAMASASSAEAREEAHRSANGARVEYMFEDAGTNNKLHRAAARKNPLR